MINKSIINGRVGKKPELKKTNNNISWVKFSVATTEEWKDKKTNEKKERTDWHNIKAWGPLAEAICKYVVQGQMLEICGPHRVDRVEKDGTTNFYEYIQAKEVIFGQKPKAWWDAFNAAKASGQPMPTNTPTKPKDKPAQPVDKTDKLSILMEQMKVMQDTIAQLTAAGGAVANAPPTYDDEGFVPPQDDEEYTTQPHDVAPSAPAQQQLISTL